MNIVLYPYADQIRLYRSCGFLYTTYLSSNHFFSYFQRVCKKYQMSLICQSVSLIRLKIDNLTFTMILKTILQCVFSGESYKNNGKRFFKINAIFQPIPPSVAMRVSLLVRLHMLCETPSLALSSRCIFLDTCSWF